MKVFVTPQAEMLTTREFLLCDKNCATISIRIIIYIYIYGNKNNENMIMMIYL